MSHLMIRLFGSPRYLAGRIAATSHPIDRSAGISRGSDDGSSRAPCEGTYARKPGQRVGRRVGSTFEVVDTSQGGVTFFEEMMLDLP